MKKHGIAVAAIAAFLAVVASPAGAFVSQSISTNTAKVTTGGNKTATFTLAIRDTASPFGASTDTVRWSSVDPLSTVWKLADQLLVVNSTVTDRNGGIKIYTDNTATDANPKFIDPTPTVSSNTDSSAAGLMEMGLSTTSVALPMAWSIKSTTRTVEGGTVDTGIGAADPNTGNTGAVFNNKFQWLFMTDKSNWALGIDYNSDGDVTDPTDANPQALDGKYVTMIRNSGLHFGQQDTDFGGLSHGQNAFVYFQANFSSAQVQTAYRTTTLRIEAFIE